MNNKIYLRLSNEHHCKTNQLVFRIFLLMNTIKIIKFLWINKKKMGLKKLS